MAMTITTQTERARAPTVLMSSIGKLPFCTWLITVYQKYEAIDPGFTFRQNGNWLTLLKQAYAFLIQFILPLSNWSRRYFSAPLAVWNVGEDQVAHSPQKIPAKL